MTDHVQSPTEFGPQWPEERGKLEMGQQGLPTWSMINEKQSKKKNLQDGGARKVTEYDIPNRRPLMYGVKASSS